MPLAPGTTDQPSQALPFADTLGPNRAPPVSATSDMPVIDLTKPNAVEEAEKAASVDTETKPANTDKTSGENTEGEADGEPTKVAGEEGDKTSPQQRAAFARERNRRQAAEQRANSLETKVDQLIEVVSKLTPRDQPKEDPRPARPMRDQFDSPSAYDTALEAHDKALEGWAGRQAAEAATAEAKAAQVKQESESQLRATLDTYNQRVAQFEVDHPDYEDVVMDDDLKISPAMGMAIQTAEDGPAIAYFLGNNPEVSERLSKLTPAQAVYEIGKISARLSNPPKPKPEPIRPLGARNSGGPKSPEDESMEEYGARRLREMRTRVN